MKWCDVISAISNGAGPEFMNSECKISTLATLAMKFMTQDELWSHHDDSDPRIRYVVAQKIKDQDKLWSMRDDGYCTVKNMVVRRIKDQDRLAELGKGVTALKASRRIKDPDVLVKMAVAAEHAPNLAASIIKQLKSRPDKLREIASLTADPLIKVHVAVALNDQEYLWSLRNDLNCQYECNAAEIFATNIEGDDRILEFIRIGDERHYGCDIRWLAARLIKDQDKLWGLYKSGAPRLAWTVAQRIEDEDRLWSMQFDPAEAYDIIQVKRIIASRITSVERLTALTADEDENVRNLAMNRMDQVMRGHKEDIV